MKIDRNVQINWTDLKPRIRQHWQKISDEDLKKLNGNVGELVGILRTKYGYGEAQAEIEINNWLTEQGIRGK